MEYRRFGYILLVTGLVVVIFIFALDSLGFGKKGIQAAQLLLIQVGVLMSVAGVGFINWGNRKLDVISFFNRVLNWILSLPPFVWILVGFFITYLLLYASPVFLNTDRRIYYLTKFIPEIVPIGRDLSFATSGIENWFAGNDVYGIKNINYPPLYSIVFSSFLLLKYPVTYFVMTAITLASMIVSSLILPSFIVKNKDRSVLVFFFLTGIFSYGMQFELERGQFNVFAFTLGFLAVYIFHYHYKFRHLAYLLISVAIQIKLYPVFFTLLLIKNWRDWKNNILRFVGLGIFNVFLLFILGYKTFIDFVNTMLILFGSVWIRPYNHSLASFVRDLTNTGLGFFRPDTVAMLNTYSSFIKASLVLYFLVCLIIVVVRAYRNSENGINLDLFLVCVIGAMILPSLSIDYKLPILSPALALVLSYESNNTGKVRQGVKIILLIMMSLAYSYTLFSFVYRPALLMNSFPLLIIILTTTTFLNIVEERRFIRVES